MADDYLKPVRLTEQQRTELSQYIERELESALSGRQAMMDEWKAGIIDYESEPPTGRKDFPFEGACNIVIPTIATTCDAIFAREINTVFALAPLWNVKPLQSKWSEHAKPCENFLEWAQQYVMQMYDVCWPWYFESTLLGTGFIKMPWVEDVRRQLSYTPSGRVGFENIIYHYGPRPQYLPIQDVALPDGDWDVQTAPWIGNFFRLTKTQLRARKQRPYGYEGVDDMKPMTAKDTIRAERDRIEGFVRTDLYELYELFEMWLDWDVNGDGYDEQLVVTWDNEAHQIKRVIYNQYLEGYRPYFKASFMRRHGRAYGTGIARMLRQLAEGITTQHRQFIDNATLANTRIWKARRNAGIRQGTKIYAGKVMFLNDPDDLKAEQMGDVYNSQQSVLASLREAGERRTGLSDVHLGIESPRVVNRMPATNMLSILQEGNRRFDLTIRDMRYATSKVGEAALLLYQQFRPTGVAYGVLGEDGDLLEETWRMPMSRFKGGLGIAVSATSQANNRELEKQSLNQLIQTVGSYYQKMFELLGIMNSPQATGDTKELAQKVAHGSREMMKRLLQAYAVPDTESFLPDLERIAQGGPNVSGLPNAVGPQGLPAGSVGAIPGGGAPALPGLPGAAGGPVASGGGAGAGGPLAGILSRALMARGAPIPPSVPRNGPGAVGASPIMGRMPTP